MTQEGSPNRDSASSQSSAIALAPKRGQPADGLGYTELTATVGHANSPCDVNSGRGSRSWTALGKDGEEESIDSESGTRWVDGEEELLRLAVLRRDIVSPETVDRAQARRQSNHPGVCMCAFM